MNALFQKCGDQTKLLVVAAGAAAATFYIAAYLYMVKRELRMHGDDASTDTAWQSETMKKSSDNGNEANRHDARNPCASWAFSPFELARGLTLRNRIIKEATFESCCDPKTGEATQALIDFHADQGKNVGLVIVSYCCVDSEGLTHAGGKQLLVPPPTHSSGDHLSGDFMDHDAASVSWRKSWRHFCSEVKRRTGGVKICPQLTHAGILSETTPIAPQASFSLSALKFAPGFLHDDKKKQAIIDSFARAAKVVVADGAADAVCLHLGHGYLLSQCLSRHFNSKPDVATRAEFVVSVIAAVRASVGDEVPILCKLNCMEVAMTSQSAAAEIAEAAEIVRLCFAAGADCFTASCGLILNNGISMMRGDVPRRQMIAASSFIKAVGLLVVGPWVVPNFRFSSLFLMKSAVAMIDLVRAAEEREQQRGRHPKFIYLGGVTDENDVLKVFNTGRFEAIAVARALLRDNAWPLKVQGRLMLPEQVIHQSNKPDMEDVGIMRCTCGDAGGVGNKCIIAQMGGERTECVLRKIFSSLSGREES